MPLTSLEKAYKKADEVAKRSAEAEKAAADVERQKTEKNASESLRSAYAQNIRANNLRLQQNRAAGLTGGAVENRKLAADAAYDGARSDLILNRELQRQGYDAADRKIEAAYKQNVAANALQLEQQRFDFSQQQEQRKTDLYQTMLSQGYADEESAKQLGIPKAALDKYIKYLKKKEK